MALLMILKETAPLYADNGRVPCPLQYLVPLLIISTDSVPESMKCHILNENCPQTYHPVVSSNFILTVQDPSP